MPKRTYIPQSSGAPSRICIPHVYLIEKMHEPHGHAQTHRHTHRHTDTHTHTRTTNRHTASPGTRHPAYASDIQSSMNQHHAAPGIRHPAPDIRHPAPGAQHPAPSNNEGLICFRVLPPDSCFNAGLFGHQQACIAICSHANPRRWRH